MTDVRNPTRPAQERDTADISFIFEAFLTQCWKDGNRRGRHLFHDIKRRGYAGSYSNLERLLATWRHAERPEEDKDEGEAAPSGIWLTDSSYDGCACA